MLFVDLILLYYAICTMQCVNTLSSFLKPQERLDLGSRDAGHFLFARHSRDHLGPEYTSREKILSMEIFFLFLCTRMYIELDSKRSKFAFERILRKSSFSRFSSSENDFPVVKSGF